MNRTLAVTGMTVVLALALLIAACGSDPTPTPAPPPATATPAPTAPVAAPTAEPTPAAAAPSPTAPEPTAVPDPRDAYFAMDRVLDVSIEIDEEHWDTLRHQTRTFDDMMAEIAEHRLSQPFADIYTWFSATVTIDGETHTRVGVRKKGFVGSQSDTKPSLKLRYDKYVNGQSLGGVMERMTLNNSVQDPSMINTCLSYQIFAAAGLPSPRCNFATVSINGMDLGLYVHVEEIKKPFLERHFDSAEGNLYEGTVSDFTPSHRGTIEKKTNEDKEDWSDVDAVIAALQDPSEAGLDALGEIVDMDRFLSFWATEVIVGHWDGYTGGRNNYQFYREPGGKFVFIPWGPDSAFLLEDNPNPYVQAPPPSVLALSAIPNRLYNHPKWRARYVARLTEILDAVWNEDALLSSVDRMAATVREHAHQDDKNAAAEDTDRIRKFILKRHGEILADITPEPPEWPEEEFDIDSVTLTIEFETTWGSNSSLTTLGEGEITSLFIDETEEPLGITAALAGPASANERALMPGVNDLASLSALIVEENGELIGITFVMPMSLLTDGATLVIGQDSIAGGVWTIPQGGTEPEEFEPLTEGALELSMAGTEPDAPITAAFTGVYGSSPAIGLGETESGTLEIDFETTWGSSESANPFKEGTVTRLLSDGEAQSTDGFTALAGLADPEERLLMPGVENLVSIISFSLDEYGTLKGMTFVLPMSLLTDGTALVIGKDNIAGGVWEIPPGSSELEFFLPFFTGTLELSNAGTEPGAAIVGAFSGGFAGVMAVNPGRFGHQIIDIEPTPLEIDFETAWGSNSMGTDEKGTVTHLMDNGEEHSTEEISIVAGLASPEERLLMPEGEDLASITALATGEEGIIAGMVLVMPMSLLTDGAVLVIGEDNIAGGVWEIPSGASEPEAPDIPTLAPGWTPPGASEPVFLFPFVSGTLELSKAGTEPGAKITGSFRGEYGAPVEWQSGDGSDGIGNEPPVEPGAEKSDIGLVINEIAAKGEPLDWLELYNTSDSQIALADFVLADDLDDAAKRVAFPSALVIAPGEFLQVLLDKDDWPGFALGGDEELGIWTADGALVASVDWAEGDSGEGQSFARSQDGVGEFQTTNSPTPGEANRIDN